LTILDESGKKLLPQIADICKLIADADIVLATGHLNPKTEIPLLLDEAQKQGVKRVVITHPEFFRDQTLDEIRAYVEAGFYVEHILATIYSNKQTYDDLFTLIRNNGSDRVIILSDLGQVGRPNPVQGLTAFIDEMHARGMTDEELLKITGRNQRYLLNLDQ
jgi:predicted metal-dependent TIM-barrel fold hydrolase